MNSGRVLPRTPPVRHRVALAAGMLVLPAAWFSPLPGLAGSLAGSPFAGHTIVNVAVVAFAAPLIGIWLVAALRPAGGPAVEPLVPPLPAALFVFAVFWTWHLPLLHGLARLSHVAWSLEQASLLISGLLLWTSALRPATGSAAAAAGVLALLMTAAQMVLLGTLLTLAPRPLYPHGIQTLGDVYAHLAAQRLGGILMLLGGGLPYLAGGLYLVDRALRPTGGAALAAGTDIAEPSPLHEGIDP